MSDDAAPDAGAPAAAPPRPRVVNWLPLSHHRPDAHDRCLVVPDGGARWLAVCACCSTLYPLLAATIALQVLLGLGPARAPLVDTLLTLLLAAPALLDWGLSRLRARGRNRYRLISGALLGVALGRSLWLYFRDPLSEIFWTQIALLVFGALAFELVRTLRLDD